MHATKFEFDYHKLNCNWTIFVYSLVRIVFNTPVEITAHHCAPTVYLKDAVQVSHSFFGHILEKRKIDKG